MRYSPEHSTINITLTADTITITNSGNGVAPESLQRLHERFFRPAGQEKSGSGLGLSIVDSIAQLHGLEVELSNIENEHQKRVGFKVILKIQYSKI
ncbi:ATP-binding protein [Snodgrassella communis]|uniref:ATP-binding protein n=1 Tax=Snodgrassella communis TaxID=2946699 RepID=UPI003530139B